MTLVPWPIPSLELHVAHGCNLACESCSHYSNHDHKGLLDAPTAERWMARWHERLAPHSFCLLGGEPTLNPALGDIVSLTREYFPGALLRLSSNGLLLHRHPELPAILVRCEVRLDLTIHHDGPAYGQRVEPVLALVRGWQANHGVHVQYKRVYRNWTRRYFGHGATMEPYRDGAPRKSWEICPARHAHQLVDGEIWKCAPLAYLPMQKRKYPLSSSWDPYLRYRPLSPACTDDELRAFFAREDEPYCGMCPATRQPLALASPLRGRTRRAKGG